MSVLVRRLDPDILEVAGENDEIPTSGLITVSEEAKDGVEGIFQNDPVEVANHIQYRRLNAEDIRAGMLKDFDRHQDVDKCWKRQDGRYVLVDAPYTEDWDAQKKQSVVADLAGVIVSGGCLFGAFDGKKLIGFASVWGRPIGSHEQYRQMNMLQVSRKYRHQGIGKILFNLCAEEARRVGAQKLYISANSSQESQAFYRAMGCVDAEEAIPALVEKEPFDIHMEFAVHYKPMDVTSGP